MSLLETARLAGAEKVNAEEVELAIAYFMGQITSLQAAAALGDKRGTTSTAHLAKVLRDACKLGLVVLGRRT